MPLMHGHRREVSASRSVRCSYTTCLLAYTTRESAGVRGFALFGKNFEYGFFVCACVGVVRVGCVWSVSVGYCSRPFGCPAHVFPYFIDDDGCDGCIGGVTHLTSYFMFIYAPATSNCTAHGAWLQNAAMPQRPATPTLRLLLII
jgi:hypothetical protein